MEHLFIAKEQLFLTRLQLWRQTQSIEHFFHKGNSFSLFTIVVDNETAESSSLILVYQQQQQQQQQNTIREAKRSSNSIRSQEQYFEPSSFSRKGKVY